MWSLVAGFLSATFALAAIHAAIKHTAAEAGAESILGGKRRGF